MSQKTTTETSNQYSGAGMANYNSFQGQLGSGLSNYASNPLASSFFQNQVGMSNANSSLLGSRNMSNVLNNARTNGGLLGNSGSFMQSQLNNTARSNTGMQSQGFNQALMGALANRQWALSSMQGFNPLQTGQTSTQTQSSGVMGVLGPLASMGLNMAMPGLGSMLGGGSFGGGYGSGGGGSMMGMGKAISNSMGNANYGRMSY